MVSPAAGQRAHSARVEIELILGGAVSPRVLRVAQVGKDFLVPAEPVSAPPGDAELVLRVNGHERRRKIRLPDGLGSAAREARIQPAS